MSWPSEKQAPEGLNSQAHSEHRLCPPQPQGTAECFQGPESSRQPGISNYFKTLHLRQSSQRHEHITGVQEIQTLID